MARLAVARGRSAWGFCRAILPGDMYIYVYCVSKVSSSGDISYFLKEMWIELVRFQSRTLLPRNAWLLQRRRRISSGAAAATCRTPSSVPAALARVRGCEELLGIRVSTCQMSVP